jgi:carbon-monoxide dehydrogenase large subunit
MSDGDGLIGRSVERREDERFITGRGSFVDDISTPDMLHAVLVRSPHAHARLEAVDLTAARAASGVRLVLSFADLAASGLDVVPLDIAPPGDAVPGRHNAEQPILAHGHVRYVGDPVAFIVADTVDEARDAAEAVTMEFHDLPPVTNMEAALAGQPLAWEETTTNLVFDIEQGDRAAVVSAFGNGANTVQLNVLSNRIDAVPLETRACIGGYEPTSEQFTLWVSTQRVHILQRALADRVFKVPRQRMRVIAPDTGGGFGQKNGLYPEYILCLEAARRLGRPVKWVADRSEALQSDCHGRDNLFNIEAAVDDAGRILAIRGVRLMNMGAYTAPRAMVPVLNGLTHLTGVYAIPAAHVRVQGVLTNTACTSPYRGAGRPENVYCFERLMDTIARRLGVDPIELRRRNLVPLRTMPWTSPLGTTFEGCDFAALLDRALVAIGEAGFSERRRSAEAQGLLRGLGVCLFAEDLHGSEEPIPAQLALQHGRLAVLVGSGSAGHGHETTFLQIAADRLGLPMDRLDFVQSDTALIPDGIGTAASWSITLGGSSVRCAADAAISEATRIAARLLGAGPAVIEFANGLFRLTGTNLVAGWDEIFAAEPMFSVSANFDGSGQSVPAGCHACEVEVDPQTGGIAIIAYVVSHDAGRLINPMLVEGQIHGGVAQGVGQGWREAIVYSDSGQLVSGSLMDYGLLRAQDLPQIRPILPESPDVSNPLGAKGMGESAATGSTPAFVNAVLNALAPLGITDLEAPLAPQRVWLAMDAARQSATKSEKTRKLGDDRS